MAVKIYGGEDTPLVQCLNPKLDKWMVLWPIGVENGSFAFIAEGFNHKPNILEIRNSILTWHNAMIDEAILSGFTWRGIPVWLSMENQFNYKAAYDIAVQSEGEILPTFKFGTAENPVYHKFESLEELKEFYIGAMSYVTQTLSDGWKAKDAIDWNSYSTLLGQ